ncbi:hypothetical protein [Paracoccus mutanolyticus]|uniref:hypothetical protein n=1 Tax=Paracoccus mutanolyticus TaxID=1499308 RepID=UPI0011AE4FAB|nr:hypothetical protein [Paracoccus mutanolyticus]
MDLVQAGRCFMSRMLTFFGKLLVQMARLVPAIGIDAYADKLRFDSPQWPLMLAFGFAGAARRRLGWQRGSRPQFPTARPSRLCSRRWRTDPSTSTSSSK